MMLNIMDTFFSPNLSMNLWSLPARLPGYSSIPGGLRCNGAARSSLEGNSGLEPPSRPPCGPYLLAFLFVEDTGVEPVASCLQSRRSGQLS